MIPKFYIQYEAKVIFSANLHRLFKTSVIRLALKYALYNILIIAVGLGLLYGTTSQHINAQLDAGLQHELANLTEIDRSQGRIKLLSILNASWQKGLDSRHYYLLISKDGDKLVSEIRDWPSSLKADRHVRNIWIESNITPLDIQSQDGFWPMIGGTLDDGSRLLIAQSVLPAEDLQEFTLSIMAAILLLSIGLTLMMSLLLGKTILSRIDMINDTAKAITQGELKKRIPLTDKSDEFDELAQHLNKMLARTEQLIAGMRQVTDNVAHDLRGPLSRLRNRLEVTLLDQRDEGEYRKAIQEAIADTEGLINTFNALLEIAETESGSYRGEWDAVSLSKIARDLGELYADIAEDKNKLLTVETPKGVDIQVTGNHHLLAQAINNMLDNALKYTADNGEVNLQVTRQEGVPVVMVSDNGVGIPEDQQLFVLNRYTRLDSARNSEGNGLGLSLIKAVADLHQAELILEDNHPGLRVILIFKTSLQPVPK